MGDVPEHVSGISCGSLLVLGISAAIHTLLIMGALRWARSTDPAVIRQGKIMVGCSMAIGPILWILASSRAAAGMAGSAGQVRNEPFTAPGGGFPFTGGLADTWDRPVPNPTYGGGPGSAQPGAPGGPLPTYVHPAVVAFNQSKFARRVHGAAATGATAARADIVVGASLAGGSSREVQY
jgi:hypothetical protein